MYMREVLKPWLDSVSTLKTQIRAALSVQLADLSQLGENENPAINGMVSWDALRSTGKSFSCVDDHPGYPAGRLDHRLVIRVASLARRSGQVAGHADG